MFIIIKWPLLIALLSAGVHIFASSASSSSSNSLLKPGTFRESDISWTGIIDLSGMPRTFTGKSLQAIESQIRDIVPGFSFLSSPSPSPSSSPSPLSLTPASEVAIDPVKNPDILCEGPYLTQYASVYHIHQGISYLRHIEGNCTGGPGPGNCGRVSCSYNSGIWFCNDNPFPTSVPCSAFGDKAEDILVKCYDYAHNPHDDVYGQNFDEAGNWNVIVQGTKC